MIDVSAVQVSRATAQLNEKVQDWRESPSGYIIEKLRIENSIVLENL